MKGIVLDHNTVSDSHMCSYALTDHHTGDITDLGCLEMKRIRADTFFGQHCN